VKLTRRDAVVALATMGIAAGGAVRYLDAESDIVDGMVAVAEVLYPSEVTEIREFIETYLGGREEDDTYSIDELESLLAAVDREARQTAGSDFRSLSKTKRDEVLRATGAATAFPDPEGTLPQRLRYYVINDLLYALYSSPTGGELVGNGNPHGHPGGLEAYQRGPTDE